MKLKATPNRTIVLKKKSGKDKPTIRVDKTNPGVAYREKHIEESAGSVPTRFQYDDDFDNWFPWEY